jgi:serine/threonine protein kinase
MPTADAKIFQPGEAIGHYEIVEPIGAGGMGTVYLARDTKLDRKVAIKFISHRFDGNEDGIQRFVQEAKAASALNHPNILTIHEIGEHAGSHYIVSEYIAGKTLRQAMHEGHLDLARKINVFIQIAAGLDAAHSARIIHRDIKPENIILRTDGYAKILDFGLAKLLPSQPSYVGLDDVTLRHNETASGVILGTVNYMSPEQARGEPVNARSDIFSLGILMYEAITGVTPFAGDTMADTFANLIKKDPPPMSSVVGDVPAELESIVAKCLQKVSTDRYQTMKELLRDLNMLRNIESSEISTPRVSTPAMEHETAIMPATAAASISPFKARSWYARPIPLVIAAFLLLSVAGAVWYWSRSAIPAQPQIKSLAVLPLKSIDASDNALALGLADSIIRRLSSTGTVTVRPTSSVRKYLTEDTDAITAANQLKADAVLEGTLQRNGDRLRVSVNLLRSADGASIWNDKFDLQLADIFAVQDTIAQKVAAGLKLRLDPTQQARLDKKSTTNPEAYENFVKGNAEFEQLTTSVGDMRALESAAGYYTKATEIDPQYALAFANLGSTYMWIANFNDPTNPSWVEKAKDAWAKAESIDPQLAEVHDARFQYYFSKYGGWDISRAIQETRQAMSLNPSLGHGDLATVYDHLGVEDEATGIGEFKRALEIDPTNKGIQDRLAESYRLFGDFEEANKATLVYDGHPNAAALVCLGRLDEARPLLEEIIKKDPGDIINRSFLALLLAKKGDTAGAVTLVPGLIKDAQENRAYHHVTYNLAAIYALAGNAPEAIKWLQITADKGMPNYPAFMRDPDFARIRESPEFKNFIPQIKETWERYRKEVESN